MALVFTAFVTPVSAQTIDEDAAIALAKKGNCFKCHSVEKRKKAPSYREIAKKYSKKPNAASDVYLHITGTPNVKLDDGEEPHAAPPTKDKAELDNLIHWILSRDQS